MNTQPFIRGAKASQPAPSPQAVTYREGHVLRHGERLISACEDVRNRTSLSPYIALVCAVLIPAHDAAAGALLLAGVFIKLNTAMAVKKKGEEVLVADGHVVALKYVRSGAILTDVLTILPTILQVSNGCAYHVYSCRL